MVANGTKKENTEMFYLRICVYKHGGLFITNIGKTIRFVTQCLKELH